MAQKSKKQARKAPAARPVTQSEAAQPAAASRVAPGSMSRSFATDFNPDYSQTIKDLKRIGLLAGSFFLILVALAFILP